MTKKFIVVLTEAQLLHAKLAVDYTLSHEGGWLGDGHEIALWNRTSQALDMAKPCPCRVAGPGQQLLARGSLWRARALAAEGK